MHTAMSRLAGLLRQMSRWRLLVRHTPTGAPTRRKSEKARAGSLRMGLNETESRWHASRAAQSTVRRAMVDEYDGYHHTLHGSMTANCGASHASRARPGRLRPESDLALVSLATTLLLLATAGTIPGPLMTRTLLCATCLSFSLNAHLKRTRPWWSEFSRIVAVVVAFLLAQRFIR